jgi:tellurite resistance protein TehA-like permease
MIETMDRLSIAKTEIKTLSPSYFALVMATGIVSIASELQLHGGISAVLFWINNIAFLVLLTLLALRLVLFYRDIVTDLSSHAKGAGFLTLTAGACILGTSWAQAHNAPTAATFLWIVGMVTWTFLIFFFLGNVILATEKPSPEKGLNGTWFLLVVSTQSLSILVGTLSPHLPFSPEVTLFFSLFDFLLGVMLYLILVPIVTYRLLFYPMKPEEVHPSYWINMGSAAITTLAGVTLLQNIQSNASFADLSSFVWGTALLFWCIASFWIPLLFIMEIWRYIIKRSPLNYTPAFWSMVFPLGMYSVCTWKLSEVMQPALLGMLAKVFFYVALIAWLLTFVALLFQLIKKFSPSSEKAREPLHVI